MRSMFSTMLGVVLIASVLAVAATASAKPGGSTPGSNGVSFTNFQLIRSDGGSEPAVSIGPDGSVALGSLSWELFQTNVWRGSFGTAPSFIGPIDAQIGKGIGGGDEDLDIGSTGTLHASTLMFFFNPNFNALQLGVSAVACRNFATLKDFTGCTSQIIDHTQADRQWITSVGPVVYISYHDSGSSTGIHVQRSLDDGFTWTKVADPIVGQGSDTGSATFNNDQGQLIADPTTGYVYAVYAAGEPGIQKATSADFNNIYVARSTDMGMSWTTTRVFHAPLFTPLNSIFPMLAVDPASGKLYASWSDAHTVSVSTSSDHGMSWSNAVTVNQGAAVTAVFPAIAARNGLVDVAFYGTTASNKDDPSAVWNTYLAQSTDGVHFTQSVVSDHPNHVGVICTQGTGCVNPLVTRTLLDLFEISINAQGKAAVIYTDDTLTTFTSSSGTVYPLPQVIVGYQN